jgi:hypothetical protein
MMLGRRLRRERNACGHGCCDWSKAPRRRRTKHERRRDKHSWKREWNV